MRRPVSIVLTLGIAAGLDAAATASPPADSLNVAGLLGDRAELIALYAPSSFSPLWIERDGAPGMVADEAIALLLEARREGLNPADYEASRLASFRVRLRAHGDRSDAARFDTDLSQQMLAYFHDLSVGRVDPRALGITLESGRRSRDLSALLRDAVAHGRLREAAHDLSPRSPWYSSVRGLLARYRQMEGERSIRLAPVSQSVHPGEPYAGASALYQLLQRLGDIDLTTPPPPDGIYSTPLARGVKHFQARHGLEIDGIIGQRTMAQLTVPMSWRVRQLELAMERLRWIPDVQNERVIVVNIPTFQVGAWDAGSLIAPPFSSRVVVGRAVETETPVFSAWLREIVFRPAWNVPRSIVRKDILPRLIRDPDYLRREHMELVAGDADDSPVVENSPAARDALRRGTVRLRQLPGATNSLGAIKFSFPNEYDVYMHATPAVSLFARPRRDFSHGCVRVQDPVGLAEWVLSRQPGWDRARIEAAAAGPDSSSVTLREPVRVMVLYVTAFVDATGNAVFADDIYGHDARLDQVLTSR